MARFLLIHGAGHGAWCWRDVLPALAALGHEARAIDLPSHGEDRTPVAAVTLDLYAQAILDALEPETILVGHSMGGYPISRAADLDASRIARLVYLCAYTPWDGLSLAEMRRLAPRQPLLRAIRRAPDGRSMTFDPAIAPEVFYQDCPAEAVAYALPRLCPQAVLPQETPVTLGPAARALPRSYIVCRNDGAIPAEFQDEMAARFAPEDRHEMACGHSPFLADPQGLADLLDRIARAG